MQSVKPPEWIYAQSMLEQVCENYTELLEMALDADLEGIGSISLTHAHKLLDIHNSFAILYPELELPDM